MSVHFLAFADLHYRAIPDGQARLDFLLNQAEGCDFILNLGDTCLPKPIHELLPDCTIPVYSVLGNHDADASDRDTALRSLKMEKSWYSFTVGAVKFLCLDACWIKRGKDYLAFSAGEVLREGDQFPVVPPQELRWMEKELSDGTPYAVICIHHSLDNKWVSRCVQNKSRIREIIRRVNCSGSTRVICVLSGHDHANALTRLDGVPYFSLNSASYQWFKATHDCYREHLEKYPHLEHVILFEEPLYAKIEISDEGEIFVTGSKTRYLGTSPEELHVGKRWNNRPVSPYIYNWRSGEVLEIGAMELEQHAEIWNLTDNLAQLRSDMCSGKRRMFIFRDGGKIMGGLGLLIRDGDSRLVQVGKRAQLCRFALKPEYQRQGAGSQLVRSICHSLQHDGYEEVSISLQPGELMEKMCIRMGFEKKHVLENGRLVYIRSLHI